MKKSKAIVFSLVFLGVLFLFGFACHATECSHVWTVAGETYDSDGDGQPDTVAQINQFDKCVDPNCREAGYFSEKCFKCGALALAKN